MYSDAAVLLHRTVHLYNTVLAVSRDIIADSVNITSDLHIMSSSRMHGTSVACPRMPSYLP